MHLWPWTKRVVDRGTADQAELAMLRELVGVRADAPACAADAHHWLKLMARADESTKLRRALAYVERQVREVWEPKNKCETLYRFWCIEEARKALGYDRRS